MSAGPELEAELFQVDAFADKQFSGNPAAVVPLEKWLTDDIMQSVAAENNLSETAFFVPEANHFRLRWFTPKIEVDLCGHATLASAHVLFKHYHYPLDRVHFRTLSGELTVTKLDNDLLAMDFPARRGSQIPVPDDLTGALGVRPLMALDTKPILLIFDRMATVAALRPDFARLRVFCESRDKVGIAVTAEADADCHYDFVSRLFAPAKGIDEDPVTGAAHTALVPFWSERLGKTDLVARQISSRGGTLWCTLMGDRVVLRGHCHDYLRGVIKLPA